MARKYKLIAALYEDAIREVTANPEHWMAFLDSACRNYRLPFDEQLLIHVQRPDAVAVLEIADWNKKFGRWVKKDSKGIAVFDKNADRMQLKHYFDISDTQEGRYSNLVRSVPLWAVEERYREDVRETLANAFGESEDTLGFTDTVLEAAKNLANDNLPDYLSDMLSCRNDSFLEELDELNVEVAFRILLGNSVAYMLLSRCGFDTEDIFEIEDFRNITDFNTPQLVNILGSAASDVAEMPLIQIADTVKALQKMEQKTNRTFAGTPSDRYNEGAIADNHTSETERSFEHERADIHETRRLLSAEPDVHTGTGGTSWEVRLSAPEVSEGTALRDIHQPADTGQTEQPPVGDSGNGTKPHGAANEPDGEITGRDGGAESSRPDEMGGNDEQHSPISGGSNTERTDLHLEDEKSGGEELPDFSTDLVEGVLCNDQFLKKKQYDVIAYFREHEDYQERMEFIQSIYNQDFTLFDVENQRVGYKAQDNGLLMWEGNYLSRNAESVFSWAVVQELITDMMERGVYGDRHPYHELLSEDQQLSLFDLGTNVNEQEPVKPTGFQLSQQVIDEVLCSGGNKSDSLLRICANYMHAKSEVENIAFLKNEYGNDGKGFIFDGEKIAVWFGADGLHIAKGDSVERATESLLVTWGQADQRIRKLLELGRYMPQSEIDKALLTERKELADSLWYIHQDRSGEFPMDEEMFLGGFPESTARIAEMLDSPSKLQNIIDSFRTFVDAYEQDRSLLRFRFHKPRPLMERLETLQEELLIFQANSDLFTPRPLFITQDEVDALLIRRGSGISEGKFRIYSFFLNEHTSREKIDFLKKEYGTGGTGYKGYNEDHDAKGIVFSRGDMMQPYDKVTLPWKKVAERIDELITAKRYLSEKELSQIPEYEKGILAAQIYSFFYNQPEDIIRPYLSGTEYSAAIKIIRPQLEEPKRVAEILNSMTAVLDNTADFDRHYDSMKEAYSDLSAYQNGTFSLFANTPAETKIQELLPDKPPEIQEHPTAARLDELYEYHLGDMVYLGTDEYEILSLEEDTVTLHDKDYPLFTKEMPREEFERKVRENPVNDHLIAATISPIESPASEKPAKVPDSNPTEVKTESNSGEHEDNTASVNIMPPQVGAPIEKPDDAIQIGMELTIDDRQFVIDSINSKTGTASLKDITFRDSTGFPIFRSEHIDFIEKLLAEKETADLTPAWEKPKPSSKIQTFDLHPEIPLSDRHQYRITNDELGHGIPKEKFKRNMEAIHLLQACESENRYATPAEQEILADYVGWGGLSDAFDDSKSAWADEFAELSAALSPEEYAAARESSLTAFYTPPVVIRAMYQALSNMGLKAGNILEPSCAVGNFLGMLPEQLSGCKMYGVELDGISGRIAQQLYQTSTIAVQGFEKTTLPDSFFDVAIGNVPFGQFKLSDKRYDKHHFLVHDYFFAKTLDKVRPGGVIAFITSKGTMDKQNPAIRKYIAQRAELLGAIRLPDNTFKANAGTEVTSDILFLQKRDRVIDVEPEWVFLSTDENNISMNSYFASHPEMILGEMVMESTQYGMDSTCLAYEDTDLETLLSEAVQNIHGEIADYELEELEEEADNSIPADPSVPNFSYALADNQIYYRENSHMKPVELSVTAANRVKGMIKIRNCTRTLIEYQTEDYPDSDIRREQDTLNILYDAFQKKYGLINTRANSMVFSDDSSYPLLCSLEIIGEDETQWHKADMFHKRTIKPHTIITKADTASEALALSLAERACVDMMFLCSLTGKSAKDIEKELSGVIFRLPAPKEELDNSRFVPADEYLSGNVREKLKQAKMALEVSELFEPNVEALQKVQPKDLSASEISVRLGATWIPTDDIEDFMFELLGTPNYARWNIKTHFSQYTGEWNIEGKSYDKANIKAYNTYGTNRINAYKIIEETLNLRDVRIFDYVEDEEGKRKPVLNKKATAIAQGKQELIKQAFQDWIWKDPVRRQRLTRSYNEQFNSVRPREYDGSHLNFSGINPLITLRPHQLNGVARILYGGNSLLAYVVGAGKTFTMVAAAMESKRLGLCHKSMIVVPNHIIEQFAAEWMQLYPAANLLVSTKKDFEMKNRKKFCARIATSDVDAVIIGHSQFERIPISVERQQRMIQQQMNEIVDGIAEVKHNGGDKFTVKQLEKTKKSLQVRLDKLNDQSRKDDVVTFEQLGIDRLFVDEADSYKNLYLYTKMRNVGGIAQTEAQKSSDMFMKCRYLDEITGGRGVVFSTGTPISNSMVELYTMQRYLQYDTLSRNHLQHFDSWASTFGETITAIELAPEGTGYRAKTRFAKFYNLPELLSMFREVADIQTADMLNLPVPKANYRVVSVKPSDMQKDMVADLAKRAEKVRNRLVDATEDNMLLITNDGRKLALDQRLMNELLGDEPESKVNACVNEAFRFWQAGMDKKLTQLVFSDLSTPHNDGKFNVYDDVRNKLQAKGIPREEVVFIHEANTETRKKELFSKVRRGAVRIMIGSTFKMGAGTNVQDLIVASHDLDCPWRPRDLEQRAGRTVRQGNKNEEVDIIRYVTEGTFDAYLYQVIENKQKFISQIMTSKSPARSAEDVDETALSYAEIKALATGNPHIKEKMDLDIQVSKLQLLKQNYLSQKYELEDQLMKHYPMEIKRLNERIAGHQEDVAIVKSNTPTERETFPPMQIKGVVHTDKAEAGKAIIAACKEMTSPDAVLVGTYRGLSMELSFNSFSREYVMDLKGTLRHSVSLGSDIHGNITRLDNAIAGMEDKKAACMEKLENVKQQMETAQHEVKNPFSQEEELVTKAERLNELNSLLNMDEKDTPLLDSSPDEDDAQQKKKTERER